MSNDYYYTNDGFIGYDEVYDDYSNGGSGGGSGGGSSGSSSSSSSSSCSYACSMEIELSISEEIYNEHDLIDTIGCPWNIYIYGCSGGPDCWGQDSKIYLVYPEDKLNIKYNNGQSSQEKSYSSRQVLTFKQLGYPNNSGHFRVRAISPSATWDDITITAYGTPISDADGHTHGTCQSNTERVTAYRVVGIEVAEKIGNGGWSIVNPVGTRKVGEEEYPIYHLQADNENAIRNKIEPKCIFDSIDDISFGIETENEFMSILSTPKWKRIKAGAGQYLGVWGTLYPKQTQFFTPNMSRYIDKPVDIIIPDYCSCSDAAADPAPQPCSEGEDEDECGCGDSAACTNSKNPVSYATGEPKIKMPALGNIHIQSDLKSTYIPKLHSISKYCPICGKLRKKNTRRINGGFGAGVIQYSDFQRVIFGEKDSVHFEKNPNSSGIYPARDGYRETMRKDTVSKTIQVTRANQSVWHFNDDQSKNAPVGFPVKIVAADGNVTEYIYDSSNRIKKIQAYHNSLPSRILGSLEYTWNSTNQTSAVLKKMWNGTSLQAVERVSYVYYGINDTFGNIGDVKTVTTEKASGSSWVAGETYYYRYYKPGDSKGKAGMLKMVFSPKEFEYFAAAYGTSACFNTADSDALNYSTKYYEYDSKGRVILEKVDRNSKTISFAYTEYSGTTNHNAVYRKTVETDAFREQNIVFTNFKGKVLLKEQKPPQGSGETSAIHYFVYNADSNRTHYYHPKSVLSYSVSSSGTLSVSLSSNEGLIEITEYLANSDGKNNVTRELIKRGNNGTQIIKTIKSYEKRQADTAVAWNVTSLTRYEDEANTKPVITQYAYTYHTNSLQIEQRTTTLPTVPTSQNGAGTASSRIERYDINGRLIWSKNELGIIIYRQYNTVTGLLIREIQDVNTVQTSDFTASVPSGWSTVSGSGKHLVTEYEYDLQGRLIQTLAPKTTAVNDANQSVTVRPASWTVYDDAHFTVRSASGFATMSGNTITDYTLVNPVSITIHSAAGNVLEQIQASKASVSGKLLATDTFARSSYTAWTKNIYQGSRLTATRQYYLIPSSGDGIKNTNYLETTFAYDTNGRQNKTTSPDGTITKVDLDRKGNAVKTWVGTTDTNLVAVSETEYGDDGVCATCTGQKNKPRVTVQHVNANTMRITEYGYDWRGRQILVFNEQDADGNITYDKQTYDNLDRVTLSERFLLTANSGTALPIGKERTAVLQNNLADDRLLARTEQFYNVRGHIWKTEQSIVSPAAGTVQGKLPGQYWYDAAGRLVKQIEPGANYVTENVYDSLGRLQKTSVKVGDNVYTQSESTYDTLGNIILQTQFERLSTASGSGALTLSTGRSQSTAFWYDRSGRLIASANYGTNGGSALSRPSTVPARSDSVLITETKYDTLTGRAFRTINPAGKEHRIFYDALGRTTKTIANYTGTGTVSSSTPDQNVTVETAYHPSGLIGTLTAKNPATGDQITRYVYGTAKAWQTPQIYRNDLLAAEIYPDSTNSENSSGILQTGTSGLVDRVEYQYNRLSERIAKRDQNGTVHIYEYDNFGRLLHDRITTLAANVDGVVRRISTVYDHVGNMRSVTSWDNATVGAGTVLNEVKYEYDTHALLSKEYSNPSGAVVIASTPYIGYTYDVTKSGGLFTKRLRPLTMKYPSGKTLTYAYGTTGSNDDLLGRLSTIKDGTTDVVQYAYNGVGTPMKVTYPQPGLTLDYTASTARDRFNRIIDHAWKKGTTNVVRIQHGYDRVGNRNYRKDVVSASDSELYAYDGVNQVKSLNRGTLNSYNTGTTGSTFTESWNYDGTGNWTQYSRTSATTETRTHNKANEIQSTCIHDRNGNMTVMPGLKCKYDAWSRLVEVRNPSNTLLATYAYNGLNQRIKKTVGNVVTTSFFNSNWQELEAKTGSETTAFVWGTRYIDDLIYRQRGTEKLYSLADPNWNVVATTNATGTVQERMRYDAFGKITWLNATFGTKASSGFAWNRTFTGQVLDTETSLMLYRNRFYHTGLGRFVTRDPIGYDAGDESLYRYAGNNAVVRLDESGQMSSDELKQKMIDALNTCFNGDCEEKKKHLEILDFIINTALNTPTKCWPNSCEIWRGDFRRKMPMMLGNSFIVIDDERWQYPWLGIPGTEWKLAHMAVKVTVCDSTFYLDNGWFGGFFEPKDLPPEWWMNEKWKCRQDCYHKYPCSFFAMSFQARVERSKCLVEKDRCLRKCK